MSHYRRSRAPGGTFFFTAALADRTSAQLIEHISLFRAAYGKVQKATPFKTLSICVLPDHVHAIWQLPENDADFSSRWSKIKTSFSRSLPAESQTASKRSKREKGIWQRRFWEHQLRDANDLQRHVDYVHFNPVKHGLVARVRDWRWSSFHRYVEEGMLSPEWGSEAIEFSAGGEPS